MEKPKYLKHVSSNIPDEEKYILPHLSPDISGKNECEQVFASEQIDYLAAFNNECTIFRAGNRMRDGTRILLVITDNINKLREQMNANVVKIYTVDSKNFTQTKDKNGNFADEWVSKEQVKIIKKDILTYDEILNNCQLFYMVVQGQFDYDKFLNKQRKNNETYEQAIQRLIDEKIVIYENEERKINCKWSSKKNIEQNER